MKLTSFKIIVAINILVLAALFGTWWANGGNDTWLYITSAIIMLSSLFYMSPSKKDGDR